MTTYSFIKAAHIVFALISIAGFIVRGIWMLLESPLLNKTWVKIAPHINDALLLTTAVILVVLSSQYPGATGWINAKLVALLFYIGLGMIALKRGRTKKVRTVAWIASLILFVYIILVARTKNPLPFL